MIAAWMIFATEIGALLFAAAWMAEAALRANRRPVRGVWVAAIVATNLLPLIIGFSPIRSTLTTRWALSVAPESLLSQLGPVLLGLWGLAALVGVFLCGSAAWRMSRTRPLWKTEHVDETPVLVSHDIGPALVGVLHYSIVVPQWAYSLEAGARRLLLAHEREHARQYDPLLLVVAVLAVVLAPWNVFNWLFLKRLHLAVEMDCDQRVLRAHPDARGYGALLLDVAERVLPSVMPAAAFVEHGASLEARLNAMTDGRKSVRTKSMKRWQTGTGLSASVLLIAGACILPPPVVIVVQPMAALPTQRSASPAAPAASDAAGAPAFERAADPDARGLPTGRGVVPMGPENARASQLSYVEHLEEYQSERMRRAVMNAAPRALGNWPRNDSALVMLFNIEDNVVKTVAIKRPTGGSAAARMGLFLQAFMIPEISMMSDGLELSVRLGAQKEELDTPLTVFMGHMRPYAVIPLARSEVMPTEADMIRLLQTRHPELAGALPNHARIGALMFGSRGQLLKSALLTVDAPQKLADGSVNPDYDMQLARNAFGAVLDSGVIVHRVPATPRSEDFVRRTGLAKLLPLVFVKHSELEEVQKQLPKELKGVAFSGFSSRGEGTPIDRETVNQRLFGLLQTTAPYTFGNWSRGDSAVLFVFDAYDQVVAIRTTATSEDAQLMRLANLVSREVGDVAPDDVQAAGLSVFPLSPSGRTLDKPIQVLWGRLRPARAFGAKR